jgi:hypothetical protein
MEMIIRVGEAVFPASVVMIPILMEAIGSRIRYRIFTENTYDSTTGTLSSVKPATAYIIAAEAADNPVMGAIVEPPRHAIPATGVV